jgi:hypothetical protein
LSNATRLNENDTMPPRGKRAMSEQPRGKRRTVTRPDAQSTQIRVALIGLTGAVLTTLLGGLLLNWDKIVGRGAPVVEDRPLVVQPSEQDVGTRTPPAVRPPTPNLAVALESYLFDNGRLREGRMAHALRAMSELEIAAPEGMTSGEHLSRILTDEGYDRERQMLAARIVLQSGDTEDVAPLRAALER